MPNISFIGKFNSSEIAGEDIYASLGGCYNTTEVQLIDYHEVDDTYFTEFLEHIAYSLNHSFKSYCGDIENTFNWIAEQVTSTRYQDNELSLIIFTSKYTSNNKPVIYIRTIIDDNLIPSNIFTRVNQNKETKVTNMIEFLTRHYDNNIQGL